MISCYEDFVKAVKKANNDSQYVGADVSALNQELNDLLRTDRDRYQSYLKRMRKQFEKQEKRVSPSDICNY